MLLPSTKLIALPRNVRRICAAGLIATALMALCYSSNVVGQDGMGHAPATQGFVENPSIPRAAQGLLLQQPQAYYGGCPNCMQGIDCRDHCGKPVGWSAMRPLDFQPLLHGEFIGPIRLPAMVDYRMRPGDELQFVYILNREQRIGEYRLQVGDQVRISYSLDPNLTQGDLSRGVEILPDGTLILHMIGAVPAAGLTIPQLRSQLIKSYSGFFKNFDEQSGGASLDVIPVKINTKLEDLRNAVTNLGGFNSGQAVNATIMPDGKVDLPLIGPVLLQGMTREEIKTEINLRYESVVAGMVVEPRLLRQAPRRVFIYGQVREPGVYSLDGPTTVTQALALSKGILVGGNDRQVIIFRRADDWRLVATKLDLRGAHLGKDPSPADEIWIRDSDLIIVPRTPMKLTNDFVRQVFTEGIYGVVPFGGISIQLGNQQ